MKMDVLGTVIHSYAAWYDNLECFKYAYENNCPIKVEI